MCFLINFLFLWSVHWCECCFKVSYYYCVIVSFSFLSVSVCLMYWGTPIWVHRYLQFLCLPLGLIPWFLITWIFFILRSILSDMRIAPPAFFCFPFACNISFHPLIFSLYVSLGLKWVSCRQHIHVSCFYIHSASLSFGWSI